MADDNTREAVLDGGPRLARGVAKSEANEGEVSTGENGEGSESKWGDTGVDGVVELQDCQLKILGQTGEMTAVVNLLKKNKGVKRWMRPQEV